jgi:dihydrofolate synthase/folylpolyglutamate synthase
LNYQSALEYLYGLTDYEKERIARYDPDTLDLTRVRRVLARLGDPQTRFPAIHIAGTKGKGSVAAMCAAALQAGGLQTGLYTSPHLHTFRERIRIDAKPISEEALVALEQECRPAFDTEPELTTFEAITALAFVYFAQSQVDFAVIEVGLGGRLDATNVITPEVSVITSLSYDHTYLLGDTLADIAREKAGIVKPGVPVVTAPQDGEALSVIERICAERGAPLTVIGRDWRWQLSAAAPDQSPFRLDGQSFELRHPNDPSPLEGKYTIPLLGRHQVNNAAVAIAALELVRQDGIALSIEHIHEGLASTRWPGRFEILHRDPPVIVDCAHNADSASKLAAALAEWFPDLRWTFVLGASRDKDVAGILRALAPLTGRLVTTKSSHARAMSGTKIADLAADILPEAGLSQAEVHITDNLTQALRIALDGDFPSNGPSALTEPLKINPRGPVCITGSIFAVADARYIWAHLTGGELPESDSPRE